MQVNEGFPMAAPTSAVLQATKRASRYWPLYHQLQTAVTAAYGADATTPSKDPLADLNCMPGMGLLLSTPWFTSEFTVSLDIS